MKPSDKITLYPFLFLFLLLSGCGAALNPYHENFNCDAPDDAGKCVDTKTAYEEAVRIPQIPSQKSAAPEEDVEAARLSRFEVSCHKSSYVFRRRATPAATLPVPDQHPNGPLVPRYNEPEGHRFF